MTDSNGMTYEELEQFGRNLIAAHKPGRRKPKARIVKVGTIVDGVPHHWSFDGKESYAAAIEMDTEMNIIRWGGYTVEELQTVIDMQGANQ